LEENALAFSIFHNGASKLHFRRTAQQAQFSGSNGMKMRIDPSPLKWISAKHVHQSRAN